MMEKNLELTTKYPVKSPFLRSRKDKLDGECRRAALVCKTKGLIFHDQWKLMEDRCWRIYK